MDNNLILEKLNILESAERFVDLLLIRNLSDEDASKKLKFAKKSLKRALIELAFDLQKKFEGEEKSAIKISDEIKSAAERLKDFDDQFLNRNMQDLVEFSKNYEGNFYKFEQDHESLKSRILIIIAERFS